MSFDLYFCWRNRERIDFVEVKEWAKSIECFTQKDNQLWYSNPKTGVYFAFDFEPQAPAAPEDGPDIPDGYFDSGLSFNLNYNRPSYFALEAMPVVVEFASKFGLGVVNPQGDSDKPESVFAADTETLTQSWLRNNQQAILTMIEQPNSSRPLSMPAAAALYLWRYALIKQDLERACGEEVFVPSLVPVRRKGDTRATLAAVYTEGLPTIIPECEWVFIVRRKKTFFRSNEKHEVASISFKTFSEILLSCLAPYPGQDLKIQIISQEVAEKAGKRIHAIGVTIPRSEFEVIGMDSFVDVDLSSASR